MIAIIDYGAGNVASLANALEEINAKYIITSEISVIDSAYKIILPGVGEASFAMNKLKSKNLTDFLKNTKKPLLGICLGMQLLTSFTEENNTECLDIIKTSCNKFNNNIKIPQIGWNQVEMIQDDPLFLNIKRNDNFYFANSYYNLINENTIAKTEYSIEYSSAIKYNNFYGVQFHPEKSSLSGLQLLKNFVELV